MSFRRLPQFTLETPPLPQAWWSFVEVWVRGLASASFGYVICSFVLSPLPLLEVIAPDTMPPIGVHS